MKTEGLVAGRFPGACRSVNDREADINFEAFHKKKLMMSRLEAEAEGMGP